MPEVAYMTIDGIQGESTAKGQKNNIDVLAFNHSVYKEVDPLDCSKVRSDRRHASVQIVKQFDKATPLIFQKLCQGGTISKIEIKWYRQPKGSGSSPEHYFTCTYKDCIFTRVEPFMPNALDPATREYGHMEKVTFGYREVTWKSETGGTEFADDMRQSS